MTATAPQIQPAVLQTLDITKEMEIAAPIDIVFETVLEMMGPLNEGPDGKSLRMKLEAWPGGRWFRDFGNNTGHLWGHVQTMRPPDLIEIHGPLFMSAPAVSHIQYKLKEEGNALTRILFSHRAIGLIPPQFLDGNVDKGWTSMLDRIVAAAVQRHRSTTKK